MNHSDPDSGYSLKCFMRGNISNNYYLGAHISDEERFRTRNELKEVECEICHRTFAYESRLKKHRALIHDPEKSHQCDVCSKKFRSKSQLLKHASKMHSEDNKTYECKICQKKYKWPNMLDKHLKAHAKKKQWKLWSCDICQKKFHQKKILSSHIKSHFDKGGLHEKNVSSGNDSDINLSKTQTEPCHGDDSGYKMADEVKVEEFQDMISPMETNLENVFVKNECEIKIEKTELQYDD